MKEKLKIFRIAIVLLLSLIYSCKQEQQFWPISKFNINDNALADNEEVKILYFSNGPNNTEDNDFYYHFIAVSQKTGDTINILSPVRNEIAPNDGDKVYNFFNQNNTITKSIMIGPEENAKIKHQSEYDKIEIKKFVKVARDPEFDWLADNKYPSIIGVIGQLTQTKPEEIQ